MKKLMKKRFLGLPLALPLVLALVVVLTTAVVLAAFVLTPITSTVTVVGYDITAWKDAGCTTTPCTDIDDWGDIEKGGAAVPYTIYIKNVGNRAVDVEAADAGLDTEITFAVTTAVTNLAVDATAPLVMTLAASSAATTGADPFTITLTSDLTA